MSRIVAINASPRTAWNTATLVRDAARGAQEAGAEVQIFDLYQLEPFMGCRSCFACKRGKTAGRCAYPDGLTPVLDAIRNADGVIIGTPNYLGGVSAGLYALIERLVFQNLTYQTEPRWYQEPVTPTLFIMTSNAPDGSYQQGGFTLTCCSQSCSCSPMPSVPQDPLCADPPCKSMTMASTSGPCLTARSATVATRGSSLSSVSR